MHEVAPNLYAGTEADYESTTKVQSDWAIVHVCCESDSDNGQTLEGYPGHSQTRRDDTLVLKMTAAADSGGGVKKAVDEALLFIGHQLLDGKNVLLCSHRSANCAAGLALLYLAVSAQLPRESLEDAEKAFSGIYPSCEIGAGFRAFLVQNWQAYVDAAPTPLAHERLPY